MSPSASSSASRVSVVWPGDARRRCRRSTVDVRASSSIVAEVSVAARGLLRRRRRQLLGRGRQLGRRRSRARSPASRDLADERVRGRDHPVERAAELLDLGRAVGLDARGEVAAGHAARGRRRPRVSGPRGAPGEEAARTAPRATAPASTTSSATRRWSATGGERLVLAPGARARPSPSGRIGRVAGDATSRVLDPLVSAPLPVARRGPRTTCRRPAARSAPRRDHLRLRPRACRR